jgi:hypothetical protein
MKIPSRIFVVFVLLWNLSSDSAYANVIKKSSSDLCHPPHSTWYERTKTYQAFDTLINCLESGGSLPSGISLAPTPTSQKVSAASHKYERSEFGSGWEDSDDDCQDSRSEALIRTSSTPVRFAGPDRCRVITGRWISPFTGNVIQNSSEIDIDHVVPLRWAWDHGASEWTQSKREQFANDPRNLLPVELSLNRSKGARGLDEWLPPSGRCQYIARFLRLVKIYGLDNPDGREAMGNGPSYKSLLKKHC